MLKSIAVTGGAILGLAVPASAMGLETGRVPTYPGKPKCAATQLPSAWFAQLVREQDPGTLAFVAVTSRDIAFRTSLGECS
jgi:hypothetical protein